MSIILMLLGLLVLVAVLGGIIAGIVVILSPVWGATVIWLDPRMTQAERRCALTHELVHLEHGHRGCQPPSTPCARPRPGSSSHSNSSPTPCPGP